MRSLHGHGFFPFDTPNASIMSLLMVSLTEIRSVRFSNSLAQGAVNLENGPIDCE